MLGCWMLGIQLVRTGAGGSGRGGISSGMSGALVTPIFLCRVRVTGASLDRWLPQTIVCASWMPTGAYVVVASVRSALAAVSLRSACDISRACVQS